ncbi:MAG: leucyl aminopeptidase [Alphaproteobacteria bacterium]|nr:leucyl aminopeptidase [Alphaproteobacteria bacterium]
MKINFAEPALPKSGALVVGVGKDNKLGAAAERVDKATDGAVQRALKNSKFKGKAEQLLEIVAPAGVSLSRVILAGVGDGLDERAQANLGGRVLARLTGAGERSATIAVDIGVDDPSRASAQIAYGALLRSYRFTKYKKKKKKNDEAELSTLRFTVKGAAAARRAFAPLSKVADGVFFTRDLVSEPPNILYPQSFAREVRKLNKLGVTVQVLGEKQMAKLGMGTLLGVGQGSRRESQLVVMQWKGGAQNAKPIAFIGKGVTFDTGGISLKPAQGMGDMKWDMGGAGAVSGLMKAVAGRKAKANVIGILGLVENMPDGNAQRPGDIVTSMSGQTVEVLNTDAEGRLVLADAMWYCQKRFKPAFMIDLATLTGAIIVSLGHEYAGLFSNNDELCERLSAAGEATGEKVWRMPLHRTYDKMLDSDAADMKNIGGRDAGSITAAQFLQRFTNDVPWAHLDIAGMAWSSKTTDTVPKGGTGYGVRLLDRLIKDYYER